MNRLDFNQSVGFPLDTEILDSMQTAYSVFNALGSLAGNFTIISGCDVVGTTVADGVVFINGEVLDFKGGLVQDNVIIVEGKTQLEFEDLSMHDVVFTRYATFGTATVMYPWANFKTPIQLAAIPTDLVSRLTAIETKLATIAEGAEVNVQADMSVTNPVLDSYVKNNPILYRNLISIADPGLDYNITITFPSVGTSNYMVLGSLLGTDATKLADNDTRWVVYDKTATSFGLSIGTENGVQNLTFEYVILKKS